MKDVSILLWSLKSIVDTPYVPSRLPFALRVADLKERHAVESRLAIRTSSEKCDIWVAVLLASEAGQTVRTISADWNRSVIWVKNILGNWSFIFREHLRHPSSYGVKLERLALVLNEEERRLDGLSAYRNALRVIQEQQNEA